MYCEANHAERQVEQEVLIEILREEGRRWSRAELERRLDHIEPLAIGDALERLHEQELLVVEGEAIGAPDVDDRRKRIEMLAAVVLHVLVRASPRSVSVEEVALDCERDIDEREERLEVETALRWLVGDELACEREDGFVATRPAVRASQLSF
jgi:hypothetical protein